MNISDYDNIIGSFGLDDAQEVAEDIEEGWYVFLITFGTCILVTCIYAILISKLTGLIIWISILGTGVGILCTAHMLSHHGRIIRPKMDGKVSAVTKTVNGTTANSTSLIIPKTIKTPKATEAYDHAGSIIHFTH